jgi:hypothetical protein
VSNLYRTAAVVPVVLLPKSVVLPKSGVRRRPAPRRTLLVVGAWAPAHLLLAAGCSWGLGLQEPLFVLLCALPAFACALHACVGRDDDETYPLRARSARSASAQRLLWALVLLAPVAGVVAYLAGYVVLARAERRQPRGVQSAQAAGFPLSLGGGLLPAPSSRGRRAS